ncbi:MAG: Undecaprenyl phosphate-alpha-4-amino-4-deoxy-L-arabinose arabinosyl transferase [Syntrophorhabdus sp. PtaU1.Bin002]|nr:MAG: Undecaprenyl phosphate-alpha-4-amino-4-deoxy-L-arabinose arabinosyl transferase [Syntrophorhabdus sp. PtaU1.Bin002]
MSDVKPKITPSLALVVILSIVAAFSFQGSRGLYETTEGRYAEAAREMAETGNYLVPTLDYQPHWTKPPLAYWGMAAGLILFGQSEWGIRFSNSLAFFLTILAVMILGSLLWDQRAGFIAGLIYLSSPFPFFGANAVATDTLLTFWEVSAILCYVKSYKDTVVPRGKTVWIIFMWISFGLGFLTKGPPSLLPLIPLILWNYTRKNKVSLFKGFGFPLFLIVGFSWFILVCFRNPYLVTYFLKTEVVERVSSTTVHNSEWYGPFAVYLPVLLGGQGAWLYFSARGFWRSIRVGPRRFLSFIRNDEGVLFLLLWIALPLLIFSVVKSRLELYVLPLYVPIALLVARWIHGFENLAWKRLFAVATVSVVLLSGFKYGMSVFPSRNNMKQVYEMGLEVVNNSTEYFVFEEDKLYGMQYYLDGMMQRVTLSGRESWANTGIDDLLSSLSSNENATECAILSRNKKKSLLEKALSGRELDVRTTGNKYWTWYLISQKQPEEEGQGQKEE